MPYQIIDLAGKPFRPSNDSEGMSFEAAFCDRCERDRAFNESDGNKPGCTVHSDALMYDVKNPEYPKEWTHDEQGSPTCTAFRPYEDRSAEASKESGWDTSNNLALFEE